LHKVFKVLLPKLEIDICETILPEIINYCDMSAFKALIVNSKNMDHNKLINLIMIKGTKRHLEYLCQIPEFGSAYIIYLACHPRLESQDYYGIDKGVNASAYLFTIVYDQKYLQDLRNYHTRSDKGTDRMIIISYWIRPKKDLYKTFIKSCTYSYYVNFDSHTRKQETDLKDTINKFLVTRSKFKSDTKTNLLKCILKPKSLQIQMMFF
jgi:hypothetical protein